MSLKFFALMFATLLIFVLTDLWSDMRSGSSILHVLGELVLFFSTTIFAFVFFRISLKRNQKRASATEAEMDRLKNESDHWKKEAASALLGLSQAIDFQLDRWKLTPAEKDVALLLLKGLSGKEISAIRKVSEKTIKQQGHSIYQKSGLSGRSELAAFFLEDLLTPSQRVKK